MSHRASLLLVLLTALAAVLVCTAGCNNENDGLSNDNRHTAKPPSPWHSDGASAHIAVAESVDDELLAEAIAEARASAGEARERWLATPEAKRANWAVKWAAETEPAEGDDNEGVEHLWVRPVHWSPFRIEGVLVSQPVRKISRTSGNSGDPAQGDLVSFPIEELTDWVEFVTGDIAGERRGGFTIAALEERFGSP